MKKLIFILICLFAVVEIWYARNAELNKLKAISFNNRGIDLFHSGKYEEGLSASLKAIELDKRNILYKLNLSDYYLIHFNQIEKISGQTREELCKESIKLLEKARLLAPRNLEVKKSLIQAYLTGTIRHGQNNWLRIAVLSREYNKLKESTRFKITEAVAWNNAGFYFLAEKAINKIPEAERTERVKNLHTQIKIKLKKQRTTPIKGLNVKVT